MAPYKDRKSLLPYALITALLLSGCQDDYTKEDAISAYKLAHPIKVMNTYNKTLIVVDSKALFSPGSSQLKADSVDVLQDAVHTIKGLPSNYVVNIAAYSSSIGSEDYNKQLTDAQANSVASYLWSQGVSANQITLTPGAKTNRVAASTSPKTDMMNYRVEISLMPRK